MQIFPGPKNSIKWGPGVYYIVSATARLILAAAHFFGGYSLICILGDASAQFVTEDTLLLLK